MAASFKGFVKNGLDSSTIINLISVFDGKFDEFRKNGFTFPSNLFFYHEISRSEVIAVQTLFKTEQRLMLIVVGYIVILVKRDMLAKEIVIAVQKIVKAVFVQQKHMMQLLLTLMMMVSLMHLMFGE